jgi:hypothetical protein
MGRDTTVHGYENKFVNVTQSNLQQSYDKKLILVLHCWLTVSSTVQVELPSLEIGINLQHKSCRHKNEHTNDVIVTLKH